MLANDYNNWNYQYSLPVKDKPRRGKLAEYHYRVNRGATRLELGKIRNSYHVPTTDKHRLPSTSVFSFDSALCSYTGLNVSNSVATAVILLTNRYSTAGS